MRRGAGSAWAIRHNSSDNNNINKNARRGHLRDVAEDRRHKDDGFKYDMKEPLLDAGFANMFQTDAAMLSVVENLATGFRLSNDHTVYGPLLIVNNEAFSLKIPPPQPDSSGRVRNPLTLLDPDALAVLSVVVPKPELLVVGGGAGIAQLSRRAREYLTSIGLNVELANSKNASSTYNTLSEEGRNAALLAIPAGVCA
ncbi:hypothetical protein H4R20_001203 [Coemansia guatemalensis]|uniref:NADH dehydrogenase [ubiquinone] 1 alpha subcomplex assembly factor 3 n=1 Tax=Coemansia guatemalensis TaxID=2761395 RepID=A0A9W8LVW0_9FUNG|nr:hypothetical protein H4R20_001203 [Coemansia guatemalensis]